MKIPGNHFLLRDSTICLSFSMIDQNILFLLIAERQKYVVNSCKDVLHACKSNLDLRF